jgi:hypothetical protein
MDTYPASQPGSFPASGGATWLVIGALAVGVYLLWRWRR